MKDVVEFTMIVAHRKVNLRQTLDRNVEKYVVKLNRTELKYIRKSSIVNNKQKPRIFKRK
jgi:hypothetical protein